MRVQLTNLSRSFGHQHILKDLNYTFEQGKSYAILGGNGSGKSTLLKMVFGALMPSKGKVQYFDNETTIPQDKARFQINLAGPYSELIEELTAKEFLDFYQRFRPFKSDFDPLAVLEVCNLIEAKSKPIQNFSSGMKQRLRLGLALLTQSSLVLLDEPTSNLDPKGAEWYQKLMNENLDGRTLLVGTNFDEKEMASCNERLEIENYK